MKTKIALFVVLILGVLSHSYAKGSLISDLIDSLSVKNEKIYTMETTKQNAQMFKVLSDLEKSEYVQEVKYQEHSLKDNEVIVFSEYLILKENQWKLKNFIISLGLGVEDLGKEDKTLKINYILGRTARIELV